MTEKKIKIAPSLLSADFGCLEKDMKEIENIVDMWHIDVMDGHFVPNITIGPVVVKSLKGKTKLPLDVHLMISKPEKFVDSFIKAGADLLTFHIEAVPNPEKILRAIKKKGIKCGLSVNPETSIEKIKPYLKIVDLVLIMSVHPGFGGQKFINYCADKIKKIRPLYDGQISIDGGINDITAKKAVSAGVDILVAGNYIFSAKDRKAAIEKLKK
ncbi:MAG: ribulose-phosphate 3-epimerase [Candidatus Omnitrophota bacterium]